MAHPPSQSSFDVLITAGYNPHKPDPLKEATGVAHKVLIPVAGMPMIWHVVQGLEESGLIREMVVVGMDPEEQALLDLGRPVHYLPNQGSLWANQHAGLLKLQELDPSDRMVLASPADIPLLTGEMVRWFVQACQPLDRELYWSVVPKEVMEATFPGSGRTFVPLKDGSFCSGALFLGDLQAAIGFQDRIRDMLETRKNFLQQAWLLGPWTLLKLLFRQLTIAELLDKAQEFLGVTGAPAISPYPELGMDIDKPHQLALVEAFLQEHPEHPAAVRARRALGEPAAAPSVGPVPTPYAPSPEAPPPEIHPTPAAEGLLAILHKADEALSTRMALDESQRRAGAPIHWLALVGAHLGDSWLWALVAGLLWRRASQLPAPADQARKRLLLAWVGTLVGGMGLALAIKQRLRRARPGTGALLYGGGPDVHSFPSGHGVRAGILKAWASALLPGAGPWAWLLALWIGWSRVALGIHYVGDVLVGFILGLGVGKLARWWAGGGGLED